MPSKCALAFIKLVPGGSSGLCNNPCCRKYSSRTLAIFFTIFSGSSKTSCNSSDSTVRSTAILYTFSNRRMFGVSSSPGGISSFLLAFLGASGSAVSVLIKGFFASGTSSSHRSQSLFLFSASRSASSSSISTLAQKIVSRIPSKASSCESMNRVICSSRSFMVFHSTLATPTSAPTITPYCISASGLIKAPSMNQVAVTHTKVASAV
mmetsp:Transcript_9297/g.23465  ORF Transcript_9297/g.23465 Transcript_9297/m.23465 type:complete len:208 (-) Transcript_9297:451-1074(-)